MCEAQRSVRDELSEQSRINYTMQFESLSQNMQMCVQVYNYKASVLEKRLGNLEALLTSPNFTNLFARKVNGNSAVFEQIIGKLNQSTVHLNEQITRLSVE